MGWVEILIDVILAGLLFAAAVSNYRLNKRLSTIREGQAELAELVNKLNNATNQAQVSIEHLRVSGLETQEQLKSEVKKAQALMDELTLITEAGDSIANRLEEKLSGSSAIIKKAEQAQHYMQRVEEGHEPDSDVLEALKEAR